MRDETEVLDHITRRQTLGSADAAAACGMDPWRSARDVWAEKVDLLDIRKEPDITDGADPRILGRYLEPALLNYAERRLDTPLIRGERAYDVYLPWRRCTLDSRTAEQPVKIVEAKTVGLLGGVPQYYDDYGDDGSDAVPTHVVIQVHHQADVLLRAGWQVAPEAIVVALVGDRGIRMYVVPLSMDLMNDMRQITTDFWERYVQRVEPPPDMFSLEVARQLARGPDSRIALAPKIVEAWQETRQARLDAEHAAKKAERALWNALGLAAIGECPELGELRVREVHRRGYTVPDTSYKQLAWYSQERLEAAANQIARRKRGRRKRQTPEEGNTDATL